MAMRRGSFLVAVLLAALVAVSTPVAGAKTKSGGPRIIIDTDLSKWWDDASTIGLANVLHEQGKLRLLGIVTDVKNDVAVAALDAINTAYGNKDIPLGAVEGSEEDTFDHGYTDEVARRFKHNIDDSSDVPPAVALYRRLLAKAPNRSVTIVSVGGYTNLAGLLESKRGQGSKLSGRALIEKKVKRLVQMDGLLPGGLGPVTNQNIDLEASHEVVNGDWPTPIIWVDGLIGISTRVGGTLCTTVEAEHPMRVIYEFLFECAEPGDGNWDAPTLLYAIGDIPEAFEELGHGGQVIINDKGGLSWQDASDREGDLYIHVADQDAINQRIDELLVTDA
jgi:hypothetical protein